MINISSAVEEILKEDKTAQDALSNGILNLSGYARKIHSEVEKRTMKDVDADTIKVALSRIAHKTLDAENVADKPIGVIDSGIGGLTVVKEIIRLLPNEDIVYLGDTARVPYGTRGKEIIKDFSLELLNYILKQNVKLIVVACNTISATCLEELHKYSAIQILGVIEPSARAVTKTTKNKKVGIIGTPATIRSGIYEKEIRKIDASISVKVKATPLFVPLAEDGLGESRIAQEASDYYLKGFMDGLDTLHLGCTHYPLLRNVIRNTVGSGVTIVDSAEATASELKSILVDKKLLKVNNPKPTLTLNFTDLSEFTLKTAEQFMEQDISINVNQINLTNLK